MKRARRVARLTRQLARAQGLLGESLSEIAVSCERRDRVRRRIAVRRAQEALECVERALRSLALLEAAEDAELRAIGRALVTRAAPESEGEAEPKQQV